MVALVASAAGAGPQTTPPVGAQAGSVARRPHQHLATSPIVLAAPQIEAPLLSGIQAALRPSCRYTGFGQLAYSLVQGPAGMTADAGSGALLWTPPAAMEGQQTSVTESVSDGTSTASVTFPVAVASLTPVTTNVVGRTITVTQSGTLQGLGITLPAGVSLPPAQVKVSTVTPGQAPPIPDGVIRISDFFRVTPVDGGTGMITLALPTSHLPVGRSAQDVRLFVYSDAVGNVEAGADTAGRFWIRTWYSFDVLPSGMVTIKLHGFGDLAFIGVDPPAAAAAPAPAISISSIRVGATAVAIACSPFVQTNGLPNLDIQVCALSGDVALTVIVKQISQLKANPAATRDELLGWLATARKAFNGLGLGSDASFEVVVEKMPEPNWLGFVTTGDLEDRRVVHITHVQKAKPQIQSTVAHEYFHHAQSRTKIAGLTNAIDTKHVGDWIIEGTARWFEDYLFDSLNTYHALCHNPMPQILTFGLAALDDPTAPPTWPYDRIAFWKMVESSCSGFTLPPILNCNTAAEPTCLANFKSKVESETWQCNFGAGFGDENKATMASALLYYTYATAKEDSIALLDGNEPYFKFQQPGGWQLLQSSADCTSFDVCPAGSIDQGRLPAGAAAPFVISAVDSLDPGQGAFVQVKSDSGNELWAWVGNAEQPGGLSSGTWSKTTDSWLNLYAPSGRAPKTMVVLVNPDPVNDVTYKIRAGRVQTLYIYPDVDARVWAPVFGWGCPTADYTLVAKSLGTLPAHYRAVWSFGDGTPDVTVTDDPAVEHAWADVGTFTATLKIYEMPANTLVAQATTPIYIKYFAGRYRLSQFTGSSSGVIGDPYAQWVLQFVPTMLAHPEWSLFSISEWSDSKDADFTILPPGEDGDTWYIGYSSAMSPGAADCPNGIVINGTSYSGSFSAASTYDSSVLCMSSTATQVGTEVQGTFSYWTTYYQCGYEPGSCTVKNQGQGSYTFTGSYTPH